MLWLRIFLVDVIIIAKFYVGKLREKGVLIVFCSSVIIQLSTFGSEYTVSNSRYSVHLYLSPNSFKPAKPTNNNDSHSNYGNKYNHSDHFAESWSSLKSDRKGDLLVNILAAWLKGMYRYPRLFWNIYYY